MASAGVPWQISGDYFENCNCDVVCPCLFSPVAPFTARPTQGACEVAFGFHVDRGRYGDVTLDGLNVAMAVRTPGPMADGNGSLALYVDERADQAQRDALSAIFGGRVAPFVSTVLGVTPAPIVWRSEGRQRSIEIPDRMHLSVTAAPSVVPDQAIWARNAHPFAPEVAMAVGDEGSSWTDYGMRWDNSGKNGHYASISWSNE